MTGKRMFGFVCFARCKNNAQMNVVINPFEQNLLSTYHSIDTSFASQKALIKKLFYITIKI